MRQGFVISTKCVAYAIDIIPSYNSRKMKGRIHVKTMIGTVTISLAVPTSLVVRPSDLSSRREHVIAFIAMWSLRAFRVLSLTLHIAGTVFVRMGVVLSTFANLL